MTAIPAQPRSERDSGARLAGGPERHHEKSAEQGKLPVRERVALLLDDGLVRRGRAARQLGPGRPRRRRRRHRRRRGRRPPGRGDGQRPDGEGRLVGPEDRREDHPHPGARARSCGSRWSTSSTRPGARITDQVQMFPGRRGAGRIFHNEVKLSGLVPQVCVLFGPSAAGGAYIPAFCDVVIMRDGNASMYLGSPRMAEMVIGEKVTLEEMGGARMHTSVSGCGHLLVKTDEEGIETARRYLSLLPDELGAAGARRRRRRAGVDDADRGDRPGRREQAVRHEAADRHARRRGLVPRGPPALGQGADRRLRAHGRPGRRHRRQPAEAEGRRAVRRLRRQGRALHLDLQRVRHPAAVPGRRAGLHDRHAGRAPGHHPPRREDDQRRQRGDRAEALRDRPQGLRRRALRDGRAGVRARRRRSRCRPPRSR